jgi:hypothetical protein
VADDQEKKSIEPDEISIEDIDRMLSEEHPDFAAMVDQVSKEKLSLSQISLSQADTELAEERAKWEQSGRFGKLLFKVYPGIARNSLQFKNFKFWCRGIALSQWIRLKNFSYFLITAGRKQAWKFIKSKASDAGQFISAKKENFGKLSWKLKLFLLGLIVTMGGTTFFIYRSFTKGVIPVGDELFIPSLERYANNIEAYDPENEVEPFYDNLRSLKNAKNGCELDEVEKLGEQSHGSFRVLS